VDRKFYILSIKKKFLLLLDFVNVAYNYFVTNHFK